MSNLSHLLLEADPLRHEAPPVEARRERVRSTILAAAWVAPSVRPARTRRAFVAVLATGVLAVIAAGYQVWLTGTTPVLAQVRFEVRLAEDRPVPGLLVAQTADADRLIYLYPETLVTNEDIAQTWVIEDGGAQFGVGVQFLLPGAERMRQATTTHVGRPLAILVDGNVVMAPIVRAPITDSAIISGQFTRGEADRIAQGLGTR